MIYNMIIIWIRLNYLYVLRWGKLIDVLKVYNNEFQVLLNVTNYNCE